MDVGTVKEALLPAELLLPLKDVAAALHGVMDARHGFLHHSGIYFAAGMYLRHAADVAVEVVLVLPFNENEDQKNN